MELLGDSSSESDAEIIAVAINTLKATGLENFQIDIGQVDFFNGLAEEAGLSEKDIARISKLIDRKDYVGVEEIVNQYNISAELRELILKLPGLFGSLDVIEKLKKITKNRRSLAALENIEEVINILGDYGLTKFLSIDLGMLKGPDYDTGIIFRGFTYGVGFPILSGGRYDSLTSTFGKDCPAIGFSIGINMLMMALGKTLSKDRPSVDSLICYRKTNRKSAIEIAETLRKQDMNIETMVVNDNIEKALEYAGSKQIGGVIFIDDGGSIKIHDLINGIMNETSIEEIMKRR